jgi:transcriptional regulator with GAF, ATPase, and Fis domain
VNCAAIPAALCESEFFGHEKGAFTGAANRRTGRFELAQNGILFLDEVGDLPLELQPKLLRVLQEGEYEPVGSSHTRKVDVRIIAATNRNLLAEVAAGRFREDLYYRLHVFPITVPPLRDREADVELLARLFIDRYCSRMGKPGLEMTPDCLRRLRSYHWPGNVRELENVIERAIVTCRNGTLDEQDFSWLQQSPGAQQNWDVPDVPLGELERRAIVAALERKHGNVKEASTALGIDRSTLYDKLKRYEIVH